MLKKTNVRTAFTLIELLVVVAIIALLLSIVVPALRKARHAAERVVCASQFSQIGTAFEMYQMANNNKRFAIRATDSGAERDLYWMGKLADFIGEGGYGQVYRRGETIDVLMCRSAPAARYTPGDPVLSNPSGQWGTADRPWEWDRGSGMSTLGGYAINAWIGYDVYYEDNPNYAPFFYREWLRISANVPIFGDAIWVNAWPKGGNPAPPNVYGPTTAAEASLYAQDNNHMWRFTIARHGRQINMLYRDLHVDTVRIEDLWYQRWHVNYQMPAAPVMLPTR